MCEFSHRKNFELLRIKGWQNIIELKNNDDMKAMNYRSIFLVLESRNTNAGFPVQYCDMIPSRTSGHKTVLFDVSYFSVFF